MTQRLNATTRFLDTKPSWREMVAVLNGGKWPSTTDLNLSREAFCARYRISTDEWNDIVKPHTNEGGLGRMARA